jgi:hypothetical protein
MPACSTFHVFCRYGGFEELGTGVDAREFDEQTKQSDEEQGTSPTEYARECELLGRQSAAAKLRLDSRGPDGYRKAFAGYHGTRAFPSYFERKWLSLRLSAVKRGMVVDRTVTPRFLERVTDGRCPVTLQPLSKDGKSPDNPSVDRLVNEVTYRAGNICVLSLRANHAKGERSFEEVAQLAHAGELHAGLEPVEWMRLASLMYGAWARAHKRADPYLLPLAALPGPGMFSSTSQVVQLLLTRQYGDANGAAAATAFWLQCTRDSRCQDAAFLKFSETLGRALSEEGHPGNAWLRSDVFDAFVAWYTACSGVVIPLVEELLHKHQTDRADAVATLQWPATSRYAA